MAAPERHPPPLAKLHKIAPVAPFNAYIWPSASRVHPNTTPLAVVTGPDEPPPKGEPGEGLGVCHNNSPVAASMPLHTPSVESALLPSGRNAMWLLFALAV